MNDVEIREGLALGTIVTVSREALEQLRAAFQAKRERDEARSLLASATDLLNTQARERGVVESKTEADIQALIGRLWDYWATSLHVAICAKDEARAQLEVARKALEYIVNDRAHEPSKHGRSLQLGRAVVTASDALAALTPEAPEPLPFMDYSREDAILDAEDKAQSDIDARLSEIATKVVDAFNSTPETKEPTE